MRARRRRLALVSTLRLLNASAGAAPAIRRGLAANWGGVRHGRDVARDFVGAKGTALSPPLAMMVAQALLAAAALRPGRAGAGRHAERADLVARAAPGDVRPGARGDRGRRPGAAGAAGPAGRGLAWRLLEVLRAAARRAIMCRKVMLSRGPV
jgi:hypothetical protein